MAQRRTACLGMNEDTVPAGGRCASTSNRNFEGRQGNMPERILSVRNAQRQRRHGCLLSTLENIRTE